MNMKLASVVCPTCGAMIKPESDRCEFCGSSFAFILKQGNYIVRKDIEIFLCNHFYEQASKTVEYLPEDSEIFVYKVVIALGGKAAFLHSRAEINDMVSNLELALAMGKNADAAFLMAYIEYDYFERKCLNRKRNYAFYLEMANEYGMTYDRSLVLEKMLNNSFEKRGNKTI